MKRTTLILLACATMLMAGCCPPHTINAHALDGVMTPVLDRHDAYVQQDETLFPAERETALRSSDLIRTLVEESLK